MSTNLPALNPQALAKALSTAKSRIATDSESNPFLRLLKSGEWVYSADDIDVQEGSLWAVNTHSLSEGYAAWGARGVGLLGEGMAPMTGTPVLLADLPVVDVDYKKQVGFLLYCTNGDDKGTQVLYKTTAIGGLKAVNKLVQAIIEQVDVDPAHIMPLVELEMSSYKHPDYGKIYTPIFSIREWGDINEISEGDEADDGAEEYYDEADDGAEEEGEFEEEGEEAEYEEIEEELVKPAPKQRKRKLAAEVPDAEPEAEAEAEAPAPRTRKRKPAAETAPAEETEAPKKRRRAIAS